MQILLTKISSLVTSSVYLISMSNRSEMQTGVGRWSRPNLNHEKRLFKSVLTPINIYLMATSCCLNCCRYSTLITNCLSWAVTAGNKVFYLLEHAESCTQIKWKLTWNSSYSILELYCRIVRLNLKDWRQMRYRYCRQAPNFKKHVCHHKLDWPRLGADASV